MTDTPQEQEPGTEVETDRQERLVDGSLLLAGFPSELLLQLAESLGNPLALLVSKAHLSKAFCEAARDAQGLLTRVDLRKWHRTVDDAVVAAVVAKCTQLSSLNLQLRSDHRRGGEGGGLGVQAAHGARPGLV